MRWRVWSRQAKLEKTGLADVLASRRLSFLDGARRSSYHTSMLASATSTPVSPQTHFVSILTGGEFLLETV